MFGIPFLQIVVSLPRPAPFPGLDKRLDETRQFSDGSAWPVFRQRRLFVRLERRRPARVMPGIDIKAFEDPGCQHRKLVRSGLGESDHPASVEEH
jgi:hypothetical protein